MSPHGKAGTVDLMPFPQIPPETSQSDDDQSPSQRLAWRRHAMLASQSGTWEYDCNLAALYCSEEFATLLGLPPAPAHLPVAWLAERAHPDDAAPLQAAFARLAEEEPGALAITIRLRLDGVGWRHLHLSGQLLEAQPASAAHETPSQVAPLALGIALLLRDEKGLPFVLQPASRQTPSQDTPARPPDSPAALSRQVALPLRGVQVMAQQVVELALDPAVRRPLQHMARALASMERLLDESTGAGMAAVQLASLLEEAAAPFHGIAAQQAVTIRCSVCHSAQGLLPPQPTQILRILHALITDALAQTREGQIGIHALQQCLEGQQARLVLCVRSTGSGDSSSQTQRAAQAQNGAGIDSSAPELSSIEELATAQAIAMAMGGEVHVYGNSSRGSILTCILPLAANETGEDNCHGPVPEPGAEGVECTPANQDTEKAVEPMPPSGSSDRLEPGRGTESSPPFRPQRILLVDDYQPGLHSLAEILRLAGHHVATAECGQEALRQYQETSFDLILMDVQMPGMDGTQTTSRIRQYAKEEHRPRTPIYAMTANADFASQAVLDSLDMDGFVDKPVEVPALLALLQRLPNI